MAEVPSPLAKKQLRDIIRVGFFRAPILSFLYPHRGRWGQIRREPVASNR